MLCAAANASWNLLVNLSICMNKAPLKSALSLKWGALKEIQD
jgi:hypothetical protein